MNEITTLIENLTFNTETTIRHVIVNNEWWFAGIDVATALQYKRTRNAIQDHVPEHCKITLRNLAALKQGPQNIQIRHNTDHMIMINESGLYRLVTSAKPKDKQKLEKVENFKNWVFDEVLPAIRKTGQYKLIEREKILKQKEIAMDKHIEWFCNHQVVENPYFQNLAPKQKGYIPANKEERIKREMQKPLNID